MMIKLNNEKILTVQLYLMQSVQYADTENFVRKTLGIPLTNAQPVPTIPPAMWYSGIGLYIMSLSDLSPSI